MNVPLNRPLLNQLAEDVMFGPQSSHARIRHAALEAVTKAYEAGYIAAVKVEPPKDGEPCPPK